MKGAAQTVALVAGKGQIGAAVGAWPIDQAELALGVSKEHQVLAQQPNRLERPFSHGRRQNWVELVEQRHRLPIVTHQLAAGRAR
jgi:hypothetical protein